MQVSHTDDHDDHDDFDDDYYECRFLTLMIMMIMMMMVVKIMMSAGFFTPMIMVLTSFMSLITTSICDVQDDCYPHDYVCFWMMMSTTMTTMPMTMMTMQVCALYWNGKGAEGVFYLWPMSGGEVWSMIIIIIFIVIVFIIGRC